MTQYVSMGLLQPIWLMTAAGPATAVLS